MEIKVTKQEVVKRLKEHLQLLKERGHTGGQIGLTKRILRKLETKSLRELYLDEIEFINGLFINTNVVHLQVFINDNEYTLSTKETEAELRKIDEMIAIQTISNRIITDELIEDILETTEYDANNDPDIDANILMYIFKIAVLEFINEGFDNSQSFEFSITLLSILYAQLFYDEESVDEVKEVFTTFFFDVYVPDSIKKMAG